MRTRMSLRRVATLTLLAVAAVFVAIVLGMSGDATHPQDLKPDSRVENSIGPLARATDRLGSRPPERAPAEPLADVKLGALLRGVVRTAEPLPFSFESLTAYAWPAVSHVSDLDPDRAFSGAVRASGEFTIRVPSNVRTYRVMVGGGGFTSSEREEAAVGGYCTIMIHPIWAARFLAESRDGRTLPRSQYLERTHVRAPSGLEFVGSRDLICTVAGLRKVAASLDGDWRDNVVMCFGGATDPVLEMRYEVPGFEKVVVRGGLLLASEDLPTYRVVLGQTADGFGGLLIALRSDNEILEVPVSPNGSPHVLQLDNDEHGFHFSIPFPELSQKQRHLADLPAASYRWSLKSRFGWRVVGESPVEIGQGSTESLGIDVPHNATMNLLVNDKRGVPYAGEAWFSISKAEQEHSSSPFTLVFERPPFQVQGLLSGTYQIELLYLHADRQERIEVLPSDKHVFATFFVNGR